MRILFKLIYSLKENLNKICLSRKFELQEMLLKLKEKNSVVHINTAYKWKADKIQLVNLEKITNETSNKLANWQKILWAWWMKHLKLIKSDSFYWYDTYIMFRFLTYLWDFQLISE